METKHGRHPRTRTRMVNIREAKRIRDRESKRVARAQYLAECSALKHEMVQLTAQLHLLSTGHTLFALPWNEVAASMSDAIDESVTESRRLQDQLARCQHLSGHLVQWLQSVAVLEQVERESAREIHLSAPIRLSTLPADKLAWAIGLQWYAKKMYYTNDLHMRDFPDSSRDVVQVDVTVQGTRTHLQRTIRCDMARMASALWQVSLRRSPLTKTLAHESTDVQEMWYLQKNVVGGLRNCLHSKVVEPHRVLIGFRTIRHDLMHPTDHIPLEDCQEWVSVEGVGGGCCRVRLVSCLQPYTAYNDVASYVLAVHSYAAKLVAHYPEHERPDRSVAVARQRIQEEAEATALHIEKLIVDTMCQSPTLTDGG